MSVFTDYEKVKRVISSCTTYQHYMSAWRMLDNWIVKYPNMRHNSNERRLWLELDLLHTNKLNELQTPKTQNRPMPVSRTRKTTPTMPIERTRTHS